MKRLPLSGRIFIIGIVIGLAIGSSGMFFLLTNFFDLENNLLGPTSDSSTQLPAMGLDDKEQPTLITHDLKYTVLDVHKSNFGVKGEKPLEGGIFVISKLEIENLGKTEVTVYGTSWYVQDSEGRIFKPKTFDAKEDATKLFSIQIPPGFKVVRDIGFEIPAKLELPLQLYVSDKSYSAEPILLGRII